MRPWLVATLDLACVLVFAAVGRASHAEDVGLRGLAGTAGPFVVGWVAGWVLVVAVPWARERPAAVRAGLLVWMPVVVVGMVLRYATGAGVQLSFVVVATVVLGVFLLGWRGVARLVRHAVRRSTTPGEVAARPPLD